jgi:hypothetical protein
MIYGVENERRARMDAVSGFFYGVPIIQTTQRWRLSVVKPAVHNNILVKKYRKIKR